MKKIILFVAAATLLISTPSCKKGENDPALSLKTRKSRLIGEYNIAQWEYMVNIEGTDGSLFSLCRSFEGSEGKEISTVTFEEFTETERRNLVVNRAEYTVNRDGTWSSLLDIVTMYSQDGEEFSDIEYVDYEETTMIEESGLWSFIGGQSGEFKNKERVMFDVLRSETTPQTKQTTYYSDGTTEEFENYGIAQENIADPGQVSRIYVLDQLKNNEIVMTVSLDGETTLIYGNESVLSSNKMSGTLDITLKAK